MLIQIHIRDLATIEELQLNLDTGCTMITGETGAGKSVFIEAIELALGARASQNVIRPGKEKADISLCFDVTNFPHVIDCLKKLDLYENSPDCIIRRIITHDGRSRCYVNGYPATVQLVKELGELLFHLHGQHEQHVLLKSDTQRDILDRYADLLPIAEEVKSLAEKWRIKDTEIKQLREKTTERRGRADYLRFQLDELNAVNLKPNEWAELEAEHHKLAHAEDLIHHIQHVLQQLANDDNQAIFSYLKDIRKTMEVIHSLELKASEWINIVDSTLIQLEDLTSELKHYLEHMELDPEKLQYIEGRVSQIFNLARKHKIAPPELIVFKEKLESELISLNSSDETITQLEQEKDILEKNYRELAQTLTTKRKLAAPKLAKEITSIIQSLSLPHGEFNIELEKYYSVENDLSPNGQEKVIFLIKTNPDQTLQPLVKNLSGGELSRLSLAAHLSLANRTNIPTLVFDEVDTGLSGATAEKIGKLLRKLGTSYQVFCVTHQAQVAACGNHHLFVEKYFVEKSTHTRLRLLNTEEKTKEIARMLGGEKITEKTLAHAWEILQGL